MFITNETTIADVEGHPFIGISEAPLFIHVGIDPTTLYNPNTFEPITKLIANNRTLSVNEFRGDIRLLVTHSINNKCMIYFLPTESGKIIHSDVNGVFVRMAKVYLSDYDFDRKNELMVSYFNDRLKIEQENNYKYLLIR